MKNYLKFLLIIVFIGLLSSCSSDDSGGPKVDYTVYKNQSDDLSADALQLNYTSLDNSHTLNFYGIFDIDKNPTDTNTITYQETNSDTVVNMVIDPITKTISSLFTTVNGVNSNIVMKFDYITDTELKVSFHEYDWVTNMSTSVFLTKIIHTSPIGKSPFYSKDGSSNFAYNISALAVGVSAAEIAAVIGGGWSAIGALSGAAVALVAGASAVAIVGVAAIAATILFLNAASASPVNISDLIPPSNIPLQNPVPPGTNPTNNLQQSPCFGSNITFEGSMDAFGSILISAVSGGAAPYTYLVGSQIQGSQVFPNEYPDGSYLLGVKDANGCISAKVVPLDRAIDDVVGTWKLNSIIDEGSQTEIGDPCYYNNLYTFNTNSVFIGKTYKLYFNECTQEAQFTGSYSINNHTLNLSTSAFGGAQSYEIVMLTDATLKLRYVDGSGSFLNTYSRQ